MGTNLKFRVFYLVVCNRNMMKQWTKHLIPLMQGQTVMGFIVFAKLKAGIWKLYR